MYLFKKVEDLQHYIQSQKESGKQIGYVPTMGALHKGHLELITQSKAKTDITVCSIFVNPTQFDDKKDLEKYPRPIKNDIQKLTNIGCHILFLPDASEVYPKDLISPQFDLMGLDKTMEGAHRNGHFEGVVQVVHRLLDIVKPDALFMGQKDYQQFTIIKHMLKLMQSPIKLVRVPIVREEDGLAMSSRNVRLSKEGRKKACNISKTLFLAQEEAKTLPLSDVKNNAIKRLEDKGMDIDYFEVVNGDTLQGIESFSDADIVTACTTVRVDGVRLLDNIILKEKAS